MKFRFSAVLAVAALVAVTSFTAAPARAGTLGDEQSIRSSLVLTTADVLSTTFSVSSADNQTYDNLYVDFTIGSLTSVTIYPAACYTDSAADTAAADYHKSFETSYTLTASGKYLLRVPKSAFNSASAGGYYAKGTGTVTNSLLAIKRRPEY